MKPKIAIPEPCSYDKAYSARAYPAYLKAVEASGGKPVVISLDSSPEEVARQVRECAGVLLPGSKADLDPQKYGAEKNPATAPADSLRDAADELLLQDAYSQRKPVLGICYGLQALNVWRSGTLLQHIETSVRHTGNRNDVAHQAVIVPGTTLSRLAGPSATIPVNSSHHQAAQNLGDGLRVAARSPEDGIIEAIEGTDPSHSVLAVQWHPERTFDGDQRSRRLFEWLVKAAAEWTADEKSATAGPSDSR
ncbi:MAG TPA: gamma-glutamyl-gamma-aminobutyrate hydrolase family protein [Candidatus Angelobacter sp.]|nr:gamma-glutamyl-gamma-aminobutyrate hydrolase family protein [Candidatus Angelobacter sp.]